MRDIVLMLLTASGAVGALARPTFGMLAFVALSLLSPHSYTWNAARTFPHSQVVGVATILGFCLSSGQKILPRKRETILMGVLWAIFCLSTATAMRPEVAAEKLIHVSKLLLMMFLSTMIIADAARLHTLVRVIGLSLGFYAVKLGLYVLRTGGTSPVFGPEDSYLFGENAIGMALAVNLPLLIYLIRVDKVKWIRWAAVGMLLLSYPAVAGTFSRGAWVGMAVVTVAIFVRNPLGLLALGVVGIVGSWGVESLVSDPMKGRFDSLVNYEADSSAQSRFWNWEFCGRVGMGLPLLGAGFNFYSLDAYATFYPEFLTQWPGKVWSCHSMWMTLLAEHGIPAFLLWIGLFVSCILSLRRVRAYARRHEDLKPIGTLADMVVVGLLGFAATGTFLDVAYFELFYQVIALVIILQTVVDRHAAQGAADGRGQVAGEGLPDRNQRGRS